ncbi:MAG TPA: hypothetical protein VLR90_23705 [Blastocatellia bacterium]|nr:hypothetical protein [Blastocatellia bacterium]
MKLLLSGFVLLFIVSCSTQQTQFYFPALSEAEFSVELGPPGPPSNPTDVKKGKTIKRYEGEVTIEGKTYRKYVNSHSGIPGMTGTDNEYIRVTPQGVYSHKGSESKLEESLLYPFPLVVGKTWSVKDSKDEVRFRVESIQTEKFLGNTYNNCIKVSGKVLGSGFKIDTYIAEGIGVVRTVMKTQFMIFELNLLTYK